MIIGKVLGNIWATKKDPKLEGRKLLVVRTTSNGSSETIVAVDIIGAGIGEDVLVSKGSVARNALGEQNSPVDAVIVGIIDSLEVDKSLLDPHDVDKILSDPFQADKKLSELHQADKKLSEPLQADKKLNDSPGVKKKPLK
jgi:ethanolamine utilization protein EutN